MSKESKVLKGSRGSIVHDSGLSLGDSQAEGAEPAVVTKDLKSLLSPHRSKHG